MFQNVTNLNKFVNIAKMDLMWNQKKKENTLSPLDKMAEDTAKQSKMNSITGKLMRGKRLTPKEKEYLAQHAPELHKKAIAAEAERTAYKEALKNCRTKEDVEQLHSQKLSEIMTVEKADPEAAIIKTAAVSDEHASFAKSSIYKNLKSSTKLQEQKSDTDGEKKLLKEKREDMKTKQEKHDMVQEMLDSEQKLQFTMQNYSAQAQISELTEKNEAAENESADHTQIPGARDSAKAFLQSKGITVDSPSEQHVSFSSFTKQPTPAPPVQNTQAPVGTATVNRAHAAYQSATPHPPTPKPVGAGAGLKAKA